MYVCLYVHTVHRGEYNIEQSVAAWPGGDDSRYI